MLPRSIQDWRNHTGLPRAMALRLIRFRPGDRLSCHHPPSEVLASLGVDASTGASDPNDFAVRWWLRSSVAAFASTASPPQRLRRWPTPLQWDRMAGVLLLICPTGPAIYFRFAGLTRFRIIRSDLPVGLLCRRGRREIVLVRRQISSGLIGLV